MKLALSAAALAVTATVSLWSTPADACGCFAPPDPTVPVVQAGERIVFATHDGDVTAHIQISYEGPATEFGWLLPLPAVPTLKLGNDEVFNAVTANTQPKYTLNRIYEGNCSFNPANFQNAAGTSEGGGPRADGSGGGSSPLVIQDSIGPYDYAVLKADVKDDMVQWLNDNRYFIPVGTTDAVGPYIRPGAFFLALKLKSGKSTGDLQPVVLNYKSDLPMIPIVLTSVAAKPDMGIQVWMLGAGRAIPRNYYHTVINDALLDWNTGASNYNEVIIAATHEAPDRHTFVTEYAGSSDIMKDTLDFEGRFGTQPQLAAQRDEVAFVEYLWQHSYATAGGAQNFFTQATLPSTLKAILKLYIPVPLELTKQGIDDDAFYQSIRYYLGSYREQNPQLFVDYAVDYQPAVMAKEIFERVVTPSREAAALFAQHPYLTRMYTTLSAEDMNKDPVFSFNKTLPDVSHLHEGTLTYHCGAWADDASKTRATLVTESGYTREFNDGLGTQFTAPTLPASLRIEVLRDEGAPELLIDNTDTIFEKASGCSTGGMGLPAAGLLFSLFALLRARKQ